jgi:hypothetical protein
MEQAPRAGENKTKCVNESLLNLIEDLRSVTWFKYVFEYQPDMRKKLFGNTVPNVSAILCLLTTQ